MLIIPGGAIVQHSLKVRHSLKHVLGRQSASCLPPKPLIWLHAMVVLGLVGFLVGGLSSRPAIAQSAAPAPETAPSPVPSPTVPSPTVKPETPVVPVPTAKRILGQWLTKEPLDGDTVLVVFAPAGKLYIISGTAASGNAIANQFQYHIDDKPQPMYLDVILADTTKVETLFEFTAAGDLRVQMLGTRPGKPRPNALADNATVFQKISDDTTPPPGTDLKPPIAPMK